MAYPVVAAVNGGNDIADDTDHTVNLPADISADDLLLVFFASDDVPTITLPEGWTELFQTASGIYVKFGAWYRIADGEEGATITATTSNAQRTAHTSYRITGYTGTPEVGTPAVEVTSTPNPPSLTPTWGAQETLWFAACGYDWNRTVSEYPADYTDGRNDFSNRSAGCGIGIARRELNAVSEDPGTFTISAIDECVSNTVAIQPEEAPPPVVGRSFGFIIG